MKRRLCFVLPFLLPGAALAQQPPAAWELAPMRFEISREGRTLWRGALAPGTDPADQAEARIDNFCPEDGRSGSEMRLSVRLPDDRLPPRRGRQEYGYSFIWTRGFGPDPLRLDACDLSAGRISSGRGGTIMMGRHGRFAVALPDGLTLVVER
jgi:hypothetical protein